jgi:hypothetical protein
LIQPVASADITSATPTTSTPKPVDSSPTVGSGLAGIATVYVSTLEVSRPTAPELETNLSTPSPSVQAPDLPALSFLAKPGDFSQAQTVKLGSGTSSGIISGRFVFENQFDPAAGASELTLFIEVDDEGAFVPVGETRLDEAGRFSFGQLAPGTYRIRVASDKSKAPQESSTVISLPAGGVISDLKINVPAVNKVPPAREAAPPAGSELDDLLQNEPAADEQRFSDQVADTWFRRLNADSWELLEPGSERDATIPVPDEPGESSYLGGDKRRSVIAQAALLSVAYGNLAVRQTAPEARRRKPSGGA